MAEPPTRSGSTREPSSLPNSDPHRAAPIGQDHLTDPTNLEERLFSGGYPRIYQQQLEPQIWLRDYFSLYVQRDLRDLSAIHDLAKFELFCRLLAGRVGSLVNFESLATEVGASQPTVRSWTEFLSTTYIVHLLRPHHRNFGKRIIKTPKVYFYDTGLLCYLLKITDPAQLDFHPLRGPIFENFVVSESVKSYIHRGQQSPWYFWRDHKQHEVDLVREDGMQLEPTEIKLTKTFHPRALKNLRYLNKLQAPKQGPLQGRVIYCGRKLRPRRLRRRSLVRRVSVVRQTVSTS